MSVPPAPARPTVTLAVGADGRAEVHKRATGERGDRVGREAGTLRRARHPGVVEVLDLRQDGEATVLVTRLAGTHTLATWTPSSVDEVAGVVATVAETVADLHHLGIAHGALRPEHVVIDRTGRPVLCGFDRGADHRPTDDVAALADLARHLLDRIDTAAPTAGPTRRGLRAAAARRRLVALLDQVAAAEPDVRPGARRFAAAVLAVVPTATVGDGVPAGPTWDPAPRPPAADDRTASRELAPAAGEHAADAPTPDHDHDAPTAAVADGDRPEPGSPGAATSPPVRARRGVLVALAVVGITCLAVGVATTWTGARPSLDVSSATPAPTLPPGTRPADTGAGATSPAVPDPTERPDPARSPAPSPAPADDAVCAADPSRCSSVRAGGVLDHDGLRFAVGEPTDELVLAPAGCPGRPALALLRPADGTTFLFDRWAEPGVDVAARRGPTLGTGSHWLAQPLDDRGCAALAIVDADGAVHAVDGAAP